jgi:rare lipoprotein A
MRKFNKVNSGFLFFILILIFAFTTGCSRKVTLTGKASYYSDYYNGRTTASGEKFRQRKLTAAHKSLPFGTMVKVTNLSNGKTVKVKINDRGPYVEGRIIDLSKKAAKRIDMVKQGVVDVKVVYKNEKMKK